MIKKASWINWKKRSKVEMPSRRSSMTAKPKDRVPAKVNFFLFIYSIHNIFFYLGNRQAQLGRSRTRVNVVPSSILSPAPQAEPADLAAILSNPVRPARRKQSQEGLIQQEDYYTPSRNTGPLAAYKENAAASYPRTNGHGNLMPTSLNDDEDPTLSSVAQWRQRRLQQTPHSAMR